MGLTPCILVAIIKNVSETHVFSVFKGGRRFLRNVCPHQARSQTMNTVSTAGTYMYTRLYRYIMLCYTYTVYILCTHKRKKCLCQDHNISTLITQYAM
jgi:hypothetical protein